MSAKPKPDCYLGTDQPHTDEYGFPLSPRGLLMFPVEVTKRDLRGFAYFIQHRDGGPIKIGKSQRPEQRLRDINTNSHDQGYVLLATVAGYTAAEVNLHIRFRHLRLHGEWFEPAQELLDHIAGLADA